MLKCWIYLQEAGALGLEALSRGAKKTVFCDNSYKAIEIIKKNVEKTKFLEETEILKLDYSKAIEKLENKNESFDIIFLDPPYKQEYLVDSIEKIFEANLLKKDGIIIAETDDDKIIDQMKNQNFNITDIRTYGRVKLIFIKWEE